MGIIHFKNGKKEVIILKKSQKLLVFDGCQKLISIVSIDFKYDDLCWKVEYTVENSNYTGNESLLNDSKISSGGTVVRIPVILF